MNIVSSNFNGFVVNLYCIFSRAIFKLYNVSPKLLKVFRVFQALIISVALLFVLLVGAVNLPFVHTFITAKTNTILEKKGIPLHIGKISLLLNGKIGISEIEIIQNSNDTVTYAGFASVDVKPLPLFSKRVIVNKLILSNVVAQLKTNESTGQLNIVSVFTAGKTTPDTIEKDTTRTASPWEINIKEVVANNISFQYDDKNSGILVEQKLEKAKIEFSSFSLLKKQIDIAEVKLDTPVGKVAIWKTGKPEPEDDRKMSTWKFSANDLKINDLLFIFEQPDVQQQILVELKKGELSLENLDLATRRIDIGKIKLTKPVVTFTQGKQAANENTTEKTDTDFTLPVLPWTIYSEKLVIADGSFFYNPADSVQMAALEKWLPVQALNATFHSTELTPSGYKLSLKDLSFQLANTLEINESALFFEADSMQNMKLDIRLIALLKEKQAWMAKKTALTFNTRIEGNTAEMLVRDMSLQSSAGLNFTVRGSLTEPLKMIDAGCNLTFISNNISRSQLLPIVKHFSPKTALPNFSPVTISGFVKNKVMFPVFGLKINSQSGMVEAAGKFDIKNLTGDLETDFKNIQLANMFGESLPEQLTGKFQVKGMMKKNRLPEGTCVLQIDSITYKSHTTQQIMAKVEMFDNIADAILIATDSAAEIDLKGQLKMDGKNEYSGNLNGTFNVDLFRLNLVSEPLATRGEINSVFSYNPHKINTNTTITDLTISNKNETATIKKTNFNLDSDDEQIVSVFDAGFFRAGLNSRASLKDFAKAFSSTKPENIINLDSTNFLNLAEMQKLEDFRLEAQLSHDKFFNLFYNDSVLNFSDIILKINKNESDSITTGSVTTNWIVFNQMQFIQPDLQLRIENDRLAFEGKIDSLVGPKVKFGKTGINVSILPSNITGNVFVSDKNDSILHNVAFEAERRNNLVVVKSPFPYWIMNRNKWQLQPPEFLTWDETAKTLVATLDMHFNENHIRLNGNNIKGIELDVKNIELVNLAIPGLIGFVPDGIIDANVKYNKTEHSNVELDFQIRKMKWGDIQFNLVSAKGNLVADSTGILNSSIEISADDSLQLNAGFTSNTANKTYLLKSNFQNLQFQLFEPFIADYASNLHGTTDGEIQLGSNKEALSLNGEIRFSNFGLKVIPLETWLSIPNNKIEISNNSFIFNNFTVIDSLKRPLTVNGNITFNNPENILADLRVKTDKILVMNTTPTDNSSFFGSMIINSGLNITGQIFSPTIKGNIDLESGTNLTYQMIQDLSVEGTQTDVVFASITDSMTIIYPETDVKNKATKMPLIETTIRIDPKSIFNVKIADIYNVDITIGGEGLLNYNMLPNNTMSLNGSYEIKTGDCKLKITGWPRKDFKITSGSALSWDGSVENPELNIEATTKVKGSYLNPIDNKSRAVDFFVSMQLKNKLSDLHIIFDIQSTDQYIMSVLSTFSEDEIMRQAVNLLLFETINLPGIESSGDYIASQINSFWESQLNDLTSKTLKKTQLSFGIDSYNQSTATGQEEKTNLTYEMEHKFMNDRATVKVSGKLNDYKEGTYQTNSLFENFIFEYALDSLNSKNLKLYQKRDYEDMLEGEVTKYGAGFLYRKSYNRLKEIWQNEKKQKQKKENKKN